MRTRPFSGCLPLALALLAGCHSISIDATHDPSVDFSKLHSFGWLSLSEQRTAVNDQTVSGLVRAELQRKGLEYSDRSPDVLVAIQRTLEGQLNTKGNGYDLS